MSALLGGLLGAGPALATNQLSKAQSGDGSFLGSLKDFLFGKPQEVQQFSRLTPNQQNLMDNLLGNLSSTTPEAFNFLRTLLSQDPQALEAFSAPAQRQFSEEIVPSIAERFTGLGAQRSSAFGQQLGKAGESLAEKLAAQRAGLGTQAVSSLSSLLGQGLQPTQNTLVSPATQGFLGGILPSLAQAGSSYITGGLL